MGLMATTRAFFFTTGMTACKWLYDVHVAVGRSGSCWGHESQVATWHPESIVPGAVLAVHRRTLPVVAA